MSIVFGPATKVELTTPDGERHDLTPFLAEPPSVSYSPTGLVVPAPVRFLAHRVTWEVRCDIAPWFWRKVTGRYHPRVRRMHAMYRRRRR